MENVEYLRWGAGIQIILFLSLAALEIDHQRRNVGGGDAGDAAGLAEAGGADVMELLPRFEPQTGHLPVIQIRRQQPLLEPGELRYLPQLDRKSVV